MISSSMAASVLSTVSMRPPKTSSRYVRRSALLSSTTVRAPKPTDTLAALVPTVPPPMMTTLAGGTPVTPPRSTPRPPWFFCSAVAPAWMASLPATSLIGKSSGCPPAGVSTVSKAMARMSALTMPSVSSRAYAAAMCR